MQIVDVSKSIKHNFIAFLTLVRVVSNWLLSIFIGISYGFEIIWSFIKRPVIFFFPFTAIMS